MVTESLANYGAILGLESGQSYTRDDVKKIWKEKIRESHPDNGGSTTLSQLLNEAWTEIKKFFEQNTVFYMTQEKTVAMPEFSELLDKGIILEVCGTWVWATGDTKPNRDIFKKHGFLWAPQKQAWYWKPESAKKRKSYSRGAFSLDKIRDSFGSVHVSRKNYVAIQEK